uniref:Uncharacterized protein n=1 Tax=Trichobilharzia regenti TaxID=157069 RepID=A0AA85IPU5_TRIRE|nr:unnamed protein product [Trichobilharzia regenti]
MSLVTVISVLLLCTSLVTVGGFGKKKKADACVDAHNDLKDAFPNDKKVIDQYVNCINKIYLEYYKPDIFKGAESGFGPEYSGCDKLRLHIPSQELLPIYENIADKLTSVHQWYRTKRQC